VVLAFSLLLGGCSSEGPGDDVKTKRSVSERSGPAVQAEAPEASAPKGEGEPECEIFEFPEGCKSDDVACIYDRCWTKEELDEEFDLCYAGEQSFTVCMNAPCQGCQSGYMSCYDTLPAKSDFRFCAECETEYHCKQGTECVMGRCI